jgi:hypothetical protein
MEQRTIGRRRRGDCTRGTRIRPTAHGERRSTIATTRTAITTTTTTIAIATIAIGTAVMRLQLVERFGHVTHRAVGCG